MSGEHKINFEHNGHELTAYVNWFYPKDQLHKDSEDDGPTIDMEVDEIEECLDAETGESVNVTDGIKASIILALRRELGGRAELGEESVELPEFRFFKKNK